MFNNYNQSRPMKNNSSYINRSTTATTRGLNSPPIDFSVNDIVFDKKTFEKAPIDWTKNDINFTDSSDKTSCDFSVPPPAIAQPSTVQQRQHKTSGGSTSITLQEVAKNLENLLFLRQNMDETGGYLDQSGGFIDQPAASAEYMDASSYYQVEVTGGYIDPATGNYIDPIDPATGTYVSDGNYIVDPTTYEVPLYCDTVYYTQPANTSSPAPVMYSPNNPLHTASYSPNGSYVLLDGTCYSPNGSSYSMVDPGAHHSPVQYQDHAYSYAPGSQKFSRHNSVESNKSSMFSVATSPSRDSTEEGWIKTEALLKPIGPAKKTGFKKDITGSNEVFDAVADQELSSLVDLIISD